MLPNELDITIPFYRPPASWEKVFLDMAFSIAQRSKDPSTQCGAVLVDSCNVILSTGFNGPPPDIDDKEVPWSKRPDKYDYIIHAEENALWFAGNRWNSVYGSTLYCTHFPCSGCVLRLIRAKVKKVVLPSGSDFYKMNENGEEIRKVRQLILYQAFPKLEIEVTSYVRRAEQPG